MGFLSVLNKIIKVGETVAPAVTAINPAAGAITSLVVNEVIKAEQSGGSGADKKAQVMEQLTPMVSPVIATIMQAAGAKVTTDPALMNQAIGQIVDGVVTLLNALKAPASATASAGSSTQPGS